MKYNRFKFRVWDNDLKKMILPCHDGLIPRTIGGYLHLMNSLEESQSQINEQNDSDRFTIQQFTGLANVKGDFVYEGDILSVFNTKNNKYIRGGVFYSDVYFQYFVKFWINDYYFSTELRDIGDDWAVIGNIFENKELIKQ